MNIMNDIKYGYFDFNNKIHINIDEDFSILYKLQSPQETLEHKVGVCWDQVELGRYLFKKEEMEFKTYFIVHYDDDKCPTHTFLIYKENNKYYWFEHSWEKYRGIKAFDTEIDALKDIKEKFIKDELNNKYNFMNLCIYEYSTPEYGINVLNFYKHCENGKIVIIQYQFNFCSLKLIMYYERPRNKSLLYCFLYNIISD